MNCFCIVVVDKRCVITSLYNANSEKNKFFQTISETQKKQTEKEQTFVIIADDYWKKGTEDARYDVLCLSLSRYDSEA